MPKNTDLVSLLVGFIFALGLGISGMTEPAKVVGFLDLFGDWDPSLLFVMVGAISVHFVAFQFLKNKKSPLLSAEWHLPTKRDLTPSLLMGSALFGIGWGLAGYCPGPALTSLASLDGRVFVFVGAMILGIMLFRVLDRRFHFRR